MCNMDPKKINGKRLQIIVAYFDFDECLVSFDHLPSNLLPIQNAIRVDYAIFKWFIVDGRELGSETLQVTTPVQRDL